MNMDTYTNSQPVFVRRCTEYDEHTIYTALADALSALGTSPSELFHHRNVLIKPNLVMAKRPDAAATTHPAFVRAAARLAIEYGATSVVVADSPGGPFNEAYVSAVYSTCGMNAAASDDLFTLNHDFSFSEVHFPSGRKLRNADLINVFLRADVIIDLCRLKTHSLTGMSCAVKNLFGLIPGVKKFQMHASFPEIDDFSEMLVDLAEYVTSSKVFLAVADAIVSMEGNGPSHGVPKPTGLILVSRSPFALDIIGEHIMLDKSSTAVPYLDASAKRRIVPRDWQSIEVVGDTDYDTYDFVLPDSTSCSFLKGLPDIFGGRLADMFGARPSVNEKRCVGCGRCADSCPKHTIRLGRRGEHGKRVAFILRDDCIKCYCCQELCPLGAVETKQNSLIKLIH